MFYVMQEVTGTRDGVLVVTGFRAIQPVPKGLSAIEECAKVCNQMQTNVPFDEIEDVERGFNASLRRAVNAIRALGESK